MLLHYTVFAMVVDCSCCLFSRLFPQIVFLLRNSGRRRKNNECSDLRKDLKNHSCVTSLILFPFDTIVAKDN